jgi:2-C-methyl-D-erythritol 4-phosphate cytidylyltransferase
MFNFMKKHSDGERVTAIVAAAGQSTRMNSENKQFADILGRPVLYYSLRALQDAPSIDEIYIVARECDILSVGDLIRAYGISKAVSVIAGGQTRRQSVRIGLDAVGACDLIAIHDGARPCILPAHIERVVAAAARWGAAALGCPVSDTLKRTDGDGCVTETVDRERLWRIQTPQVFRSGIIRNAHEAASGLEATDDCALVEAAGGTVRVVAGDSANIKITTPDDLALARAVLREREDAGL